jgi:hypothetical protein
MRDSGGDERSAGKRQQQCQWTAATTHRPAQGKPTTLRVIDDEFGVGDHVDAATQRISANGERSVEIGALARPRG